MTSEDSRSAIFLPESEAGHLLCNSQDGDQTAQSGQDLVRVSHSVKRASKKPKPTKGISGQNCSGSSESVSLTQYLANRLAQQLDTGGSMEYRTTWRQKTTPLGRLYWEHSASAHLTKEADCFGWPTAQASEKTGPEKLQSKQAKGSGGINLQQAATLTPWGTPASRDWKDGSQADVKTNGLLGRQAWLSPASTENRGVLDAALSRWLMGFPEAWDRASPNYEIWLKAQEVIASAG
jgi:hypothetical protein